MIKFFCRLLALFFLVGFAFITTQKLTSLLLSKENLRIKTKTGLLIAGDSHAQYGFKINQLKDAANIGASAEPYLYTYYKLRWMLDANPTIKKVVLTCGAHNINSSGDFKFINDPDYTNWGFMTYYMLLDKEGIKDIKLLNKGESAFKQFLKYDLYLRFKTNTIFSKLLLTDKFPKMFGFYKGGTRDEDNKSKALTEIKHHKHFFVNDSVMPTSLFAVKYLDKIAALCNQKGIELYLVSTPVYINYYNNIPAPLLKEFYEEMKKLEKKYLHVHYFDFYNYPFPDETYYRDLHHINPKGTPLFTKKINELIN